MPLFTQNTFKTLSLPTKFLCVKKVIDEKNGDTINFTTSATQCRISDNGKNYFCDQLNYEDFTLFFD